MRGSLPFSVAASLLSTYQYGTAQPPAIIPDGVFNAASRIQQSLPGSGLARGARIIIEGVRLGGRSRAILTRGTEQWELPVRHVNERQIEAMVPRSVPPGSASLQAVRDEEASVAVRVAITESTFGIFSRNGKGWGPGEIHDAGGAQVTSQHPARPGTVVSISGTGLGTATHADILVAGRHARVQSIHSDADGLDQATFEIPQDVPEGCYVPVCGRVAGVVSNTVTIAIRASAGQCVEPAPWPPGGLPSGDAAGFVLLTRARMQLQTAADRILNFTDDEALAGFLKHGGKEWSIRHMNVVPPPGTCVTYTGTYQQELRPSTSLLDIVRTWVAGEPLDAGREMIIRRANKTVHVPASTPGHEWFSAIIGGGAPLRYGPVLPLFLEAGTLEITSEGGADIGDFQVALKVPNHVRWANTRTGLLIDRSKGAPLEWHGSNRTEHIGIIAANVNQRTAATAACFCVAPVGSRGWTIPADAFAHFPETEEIPGLPLSVLFLIVLPAVAPEPIHARGLDFGYAMYLSVEGRSVVYR
jgi:uncharacterized protein (TIGR03437 family)